MIGILIGIVVVGAFTLGLAFILDTQATEMRWRHRAIIAAAGGAFVPMLLPIVTILVAEGGAGEIWVVVLTLLFGALILATVVGFPLAYWFCKRREEARNPSNPEQIFE